MNRNAGKCKQVVLNAGSTTKEKKDDPRPSFFLLVDANHSSLKKGNNLMYTKNRVAKSYVHKNQKTKSYVHTSYVHTTQNLMYTRREILCTQKTGS